MEVQGVIAWEASGGHYISPGDRYQNMSRNDVNLLQILLGNVQCTQCFVLLQNHHIPQQGRAWIHQWKFIIQKFSTLLKQKLVDVRVHNTFEQNQVSMVTVSLSISLIKILLTIFRICCHKEICITAHNSEARQLSTKLLKKKRVEYILNKEIPILYAFPSMHAQFIHNIIQHLNIQYTYNHHTSTQVRTSRGQNS